MPIDPNQLPDDIDALKSLVAGQVARNEQLTTENQRYKTQILTLQEQLNLALAKRYAASSEKISPDQVCMFNEAEAAVESAPDADDEIIVPAHTRKKRGRKPLPDNLPRIDVVHELPKSERHCDLDGQLLVEIGEDPGHPAYPQEIRLQLRPVYQDSTASGAADPQEHGIAWVAGTHYRLEVSGCLATLPAGDNPAAYRCRHPPCNIGELDGPGRNVDPAVNQTAAGSITGL